MSILVRNLIPEISFKAEIPQTKDEIINLSNEQWKEIFFIKTTSFKEYLNNEPV